MRARRRCLTVDGIPFAGGSDAEGVTVSAAALFLLRLAHVHGGTPGG